ncbi:HRDC domain-containing protein [Pseudalkalibacillus hwajinpoensis]|uniref:Helicase n=1 Tax=Guptibacillus hwajinpoensis TaxID=208199 RepID=A0A4U1MHK8_9BACL|nr:HRDC domain-containing protein [Pseudalkalibacillus hwajinpoensis]TKD70789.1 helicase [Pseudalkalibacillus hwajinpoensis]
MSLLKNVFNILTDKRDIKESILYKESTETSAILKSLTDLKLSNAANLDNKKIDNHLKLFSIGQTGEQQVLFELQNAMLPYLILHDVYLEFEEYQAQMDFVIITHKFILVLEVKKLFGNIHVTDKGEFQRVITKNNRVVNKEGMYSPINQVGRHVEILEKLLKSNGTITKCPIRYAVTFANPKTILDLSKNAPANIQSNVIRHDQIKTFLKSELDKKSPVFMLDQQLYQIADTILQNHKQKPFNQESYVLDSPPPTVKKETSLSSAYNDQETDQDLKAMLVAYRLKKSQELGRKPYHIFTNKMLEEFLLKQPSTVDELLEIEGVGSKIASEYGEDLLAIIRRGKDLPVYEIAHSEAHSQLAASKEDSVDNVNKGNGELLRLSLVEFRTTRSKELNVKPYYIFTNRTLEDILTKRPASMKELLNIEGIGPKKAEEFGQGILELIKRDRH